jgi:hypothetical protein
LPQTGRFEAQPQSALSSLLVFRSSASLVLLRVSWSNISISLIMALRWALERNGLMTSVDPHQMHFWYFRVY